MINGGAFLHRMLYISNADFFVLKFINKCVIVKLLIIIVLKEKDKV